MYIEATGPSSSDKAILESPPITWTWPITCVQFWYHMQGSQMGTLRLLTSYPGASIGTQVWSKSGDQGEHWNRGSVTLRTGHVHLKVRFFFKFQGK